MQAPIKTKLTNQQMVGLLAVGLFSFVFATVMLFFAGYFAVEVFHGLGYFPNLAPKTLGIFLALFNIAMSIKNPLAGVIKK